MEYLENANYVIKDEQLRNNGNSPQKYILTYLARDGAFKSINPKLTKIDKFNLCNLPFANSVDGQNKFELCDIYLSIENIRQKLSIKEIEAVYMLCVNAANQAGEEEDGDT